MKYMVIVERGPSSFGAYVPDLPGCIAAATSREEVLVLIREAMALHIDDLQRQGLPVPQAVSSSEVMEFA